MKMHRTQVCLTVSQYKNLKQVAHVLELSMGEYLRRVIDKHLVEIKKKIDRNIPIGTVKGG